MLVRTADNPSNSPPDAPPSAPSDSLSRRSEGQRTTSSRQKGRNGGPNLRDVAAATGVSVATVSLVLNDSRRISDATKLRVRRVMGELGYQPNRLAQSLSGRYTKVLGVLVPGLRHTFADGYFGEIISGVSDEADVQEYKVLLEQANPAYVAARRHCELFERRYVDGVLLLGTTDHSTVAADLAKAGHPAVVVDNTLRFGEADIDHVVGDYASGAGQAMNYLRQLGHRNVGLLYAAGEIATTRRVVEIWRDHGRKLGHDDATLDSLTEDGQFTERGGAAAVGRLLKRRPDVTAVLATNDKMAIGAMHLLHRRSVRVPEDVSLIGFDDLPQAAFVRPSLTTIHLPLYEVGRLACRRLVERVQGKLPAVAETLGTHLVVRDSTAMARPVHNNDTAEDR